LIHAGWFQRRKSAVQQEKIAVKYRFFKANAKLVNAFQKRPVFTIMLMVKSGKNSCKIRDFFFLRKHSINKKENKKESLVLSLFFSSSFCFLCLSLLRKKLFLH